MQERRYFSRILPCFPWHTRRNLSACHFVSWSLQARYQLSLLLIVKLCPLVSLADFIRPGLQEATTLHTLNAVYHRELIDFLLGAPC